MEERNKRKIHKFECPETVERDLVWFCCEDCRKGHESTCVDADLHGFTVDGSFQQWCVSFSEHVTPIPTDLPMHAAAPILCAGVTVYKALKEIEGNCGDFVVIPGAGGGLD
ncbi:alcohol dehydrogenase [Phytophthora pseudosyringae]|uniref:Alcohol dehydrogenase n=1 Tax=Phytophthora pseudosyringae TaxID=221518 RepID=A0A8T1VN10_9STRA|nr:alcohol dehydrogenase [Phytophthora pseudosyringae]